ncbi:hypothetical protein K435DRAFT_671013, partial [Dendrothele bispora CBS 962.96]
DRPVLAWLKLRDRILAAFMTLKGRGQNISPTCQFCATSKSQDTKPPLYRCRECHGQCLMCEDCIVSQHWANPLHRIEKWNDKFFEPISLDSLGLRMQLGHPDGSVCQRPLPGPQGFVVIHSNGLHQINIDYCGCRQNGHQEPWEQLLYCELFSATTERPQTCCSFRMLELFHLLNLEGKTTAFNFYDSLEKLTDNTGCIVVKRRYYAFLRVMRLWRHIRMLKRSGMGVGGLSGDLFRTVEQTSPGELVVKCIACPIPEVNLPKGWQNAPPNLKFLYNFFLAIDACFRLKRRKISSWEKDPSLQDGWAYFVEHEPYKKWCGVMSEQKEMSTCTNLASLDYANTKFHVGYDASGGAAGICARHEFLLANGYGQTQVGERYANIDFIVASLLRHICALLFLVISYDIACQWSKKIVERFMNLPPLIRLVLIIRITRMRFVIPKLHILAHLLKCQELFSLNYSPGVGQTDAESIERLWSNLGPVTTSLKEMGPGSHHDTLEDHFGHWNWCKLIGMGALLKQRFIKHSAELLRQEAGFATFTAGQIEEVPAWKKMVDDFEDGSGKENPYSLPKSGTSRLTLQDVRLDLAKEDETKAIEGVPAICDTAPGEFIYTGLEIEHQQRQLRLDISRTRNPTLKELTGFVDRRAKITRHINHFRSVQLKYMPISLQLLAIHPMMTKPNSPNAEDIPLLLPSALTRSQRLSGQCNSNLAEIESRLRDAQCEESLNKLRHGLLVKRRLLDYKNRNARHQGPTTRSRSYINQQQYKIDLSAATYHNAWTAKLALVGGKVDDVGWEKLQADDVRCMEDLDEVVRKEREAARKKGKELPDGAGESRRMISWIWETSKRGVNGTTEAVLFEGLRVEWCKAYARVRRYREEILLLKEEMRRCLVTLEWQAQQWLSKANPTSFGEAHADGISAYAYQQGALRRKIASRFRVMWAGFDLPDETTAITNDSQNVGFIEPPLLAIQHSGEAADVNNDEDDGDYNSEREVDSEEEVMEEVEEDMEEIVEEPMDVYTRLAFLETK